MEQRSVTLNLGGDYSSSTWQSAKDAGTGTIFHDPPADSGTATIDSGASPASMLTTATDSVSFISGTSQVIGTDPSDLTSILSSRSPLPTTVGTVGRRMAPWRASTAVSDPAGGETTNVTVNRERCCGSHRPYRLWTGLVDGSIPALLRSSPLSHGVSGNLTDNRNGRGQQCRLRSCSDCAVERPRCGQRAGRTNCDRIRVMLVLQYLTREFEARERCQCRHADRRSTRKS